MKLLIKIPTRERDYEYLRPYVDFLEMDSTKIVLTLDRDANQLPEWIMNNDRIHAIIGDSLNKVHAYNRDIEKIPFEWDIILCGSDDMEPKISGFDRIICDDMQKYYPDLDGCLWYDTEDQHKLPHIGGPKGSRNFLNRGICMLPIMGRKYYERFNYVYNPEYIAFYCDNEQTRVAQRLGKIQYIENRIIAHEHPAWGAKRNPDQLYERNNPHFTRDRQTFNKRNRYGFQH